MILLAHIIVALASLAFSIYLLFRPSIVKLKLSYGLVGLTVVSGTFLTITESAHILQTCVAGLVYVGIVAAILAFGQRKLARAANVG